jgi:hypothetical protein
MLPSLCPAMAANPSVSRFWLSVFKGMPGRQTSGGTGDRPFGNHDWGARPIECRVLPSGGQPGGGQQRLIVGFHAASWQHRCLDCGTLISERSLRSRHPMSCRRPAAAGKEPPMAGACMVGEVLG